MGHYGNFGRDVGGTEMESAMSTKFLGMEIQPNLTWTFKIDALENKLDKILFVLHQLSHSIQLNELGKILLCIYPFLLKGLLTSLKCPSEKFLNCKKKGTSYC